MAKTVSYGMGQYRFTKNFNYISKLNTELLTDHYKIGNSSTGYYQDVLVKLPIEQSTNTPVVQYGQNYFLKLTVPQNRQYTVTLNLKLCPADTEGNPILERFQQIGRIEIPPTPDDDDIYSEVVLYQDPISEKTKVGLIDFDHNEIENQYIAHKNGELYKTMSNDGKILYKYYYLSEEGNILSSEDVINLNSTKMVRGWEIIGGIDNMLTYKLAFSPKYNLAEGYRYLLIETDRNNVWTNEIQYIGTDGNTYNGTYLNIASMNVELYSINDLLVGASDGSSQIKSRTNVLNHIAVWGHPEQIIVINGEEIKIGKSNFYEIKDYSITSLGVVVEDPNVDRFTIDYEYKINS